MRSDIIGINTEEEYKPVICFKNKQIDQFLKEKFDSLNVDDKLTLTINFKVVSVSKREEMEHEYDSKGERSKEPVKKMRKSVELELVNVQDKNSIASGKASMQQHKAGI